MTDRDGFPRKRWRMRAAAPEALRAALPALHPVVVQLLYGRGHQTPEAILEYLGDGVGEHDPFLLPDMERAAERVARAIRGGEPVGIYGDFDVDGLTGAAVLSEAVRLAGGRSVVFIPNRTEEGHGLNERGLDWLRERGCRIVISADCGITDVGAAAYGAGLGLDLIVTDHHLINGEIAPAFAAINPRRPDARYPYPDLAGVGVAYKLAAAVLAQFPERRADPAELLDLVAVGTIADVAHLGGENRLLVRRGLEALTRTTRVGLRQMLGDAVSAARPATAEQVAYAVAPRLNAAGRMGDAAAAYRLLVTRDPLEAARLLAELDRLNTERQRLTSSLLAQARAAVGRRDGGAIVIHRGERLPIGVLGLVAGRLAEEQNRPAVVISIDGDVVRGSARSPAVFNIAEALSACTELLLKHGGHAAAAGFSAPVAHLEALCARLEACAAERLAGKDLTPALWIDQELRSDEYAYRTYVALRQLAPFGQGNPKPVFLTRGLRLVEQRPVGDVRQHLRLRLHDGRQPVSAIAFGWGNQAGRLPDRLDVVYELDTDEYRGTVGLQMRVLDIGPAGAVVVA